MTSAEAPGIHDEWCAALSVATTITESAELICRTRAHDQWALRGAIYSYQNARRILDDSRISEEDREIRGSLIAHMQLRIQILCEWAVLIAEAPLAFWRAFAPERVSEIEDTERLWAGSCQNLREALANGTARASLA